MKKGNSHFILYIIQQKLINKTHLHQIKLQNKLVPMHKIKKKLVNTFILKII